MHYSLNAEVFLGIIVFSFCIGQRRLYNRFQVAVFSPIGPFSLRFIY